MKKVKNTQGTSLVRQLKMEKLKVFMKLCLSARPLKPTCSSVLMMMGEEGDFLFVCWLIFHFGL